MPKGNHNIITIKSACMFNDVYTVCKHLCNEFKLLSLCFFAVPCAPGSFFNNSGLATRCDPCPFHHYEDESEQTECKACPNGTFTIARGSDEIQDCRGIYSVVHSGNVSGYPQTDCAL